MSIDKSTPPSTGSTSARRRLIRGAFAAPVALTLYSGNAMAAASLSCVARRSATPNLPAPSDVSDNWIRVQAYRLGDSQWVRVNEVTGFAGTQGSLVAYTPGGDWVCVIGGSGFQPGAVSNGEPTLVGHHLDAKPQGKYVAVRFDNAGRIIGVVDITNSASSGTALSASCWTSFRVAGGR